MTYDFHPEAEEEFLSAINYYEECHIGLGYDFAREVYSAIQSIIEHPKTWPVFHMDILDDSLAVFHMPFSIAMKAELCIFLQLCICVVIQAIGNQG